MQHKHTAQGLASLGRGPDTELVHMTKGEVHGLQKLAMSQGGSLTINPDTGLVEAGFLSSLLPMALGAGAMMIPGLQGYGAGMIAAGIGGATALATGSLKKGLMAGLGAYGGAGMAGSLMGAGAASAGTVGAAEAGSLTNAAQADLLSAQTAGNADAYNTLSKAASAAPVTITPPGGLPAALPAPTIIPAPAALPADMTGYGYLDPAMQATYTPPVAPVTAAVPPTGAAASAYPQVVEPLNYDPYDFGRATSKLTPYEQMGAGLKDVTSSGAKAMQFASQNKGALMGLGVSALGSMGPSKLNAPEQNPGMIRPYTFSRARLDQPDALTAQYVPGQSTRERQYFNDQYTAGTPYKAPGPEYMAGGGPVEEMSNANAIGANTGYPMADIHTGAYATPYQQPMSENVVEGAQDSAVNPYTGQAMFDKGGDVIDESSTLSPEELMKRLSLSGGASSDKNVTQMGGRVGYTHPLSEKTKLSGGLAGHYAKGKNFRDYGIDRADVGVEHQIDRDSYIKAMLGGNRKGIDQGQITYNRSFADGGISNLGDYSDGGRLLRGPGDGVSDNIPATIGNKRPARLADGEFVVPARIVSELGNGSTEAGARKLYAMMERVQNARKKSIGKGKVATNSRAAKLLPA